MSSDLRARVLAAAAKAPSPTRAEARRRAVAIVAAGVVVTAVLFVTTGGIHLGERPIELVMCTVAVGLVLAIALTQIAVGRTRSMLGRPRAVLASAVGVGAFVFAASAVATFVWWKDHAGAAPLTAHVSCGALTVVQGAALFAALFVLRRGTDPVHPAMTGAALGMTAGAWTLTMAYLRCPHADALHCVVAHVVPAVMLAALGAVVGRTVLRIR